VAGNSILFILHTIALLATVAFFVVRVPAALRVGERAKAFFVILLAVIIVLGIWIRFDHTPHRFKVFYVEYEIHNIARMISNGNDFSICSAGTVEKCEDRQPPVYGTGFPFIGAVAMKLTGSDSPRILFTVNAVLGVLCIPVVFIMAMAATGRARSALFASLAATLLPLNVIMSGNATTETADLLFLCVAFTFMFLYIRNGDILSGAGLYSAVVFSILVEPRNVYTAAFIFIVLLVSGSRDIKRVAIQVAGPALLIVLVFLLPPVYRSVFTLPPGDYPDILKTNMLFLFSSPFIPYYISVPLVFAPVFLGRRCGVSRPLFFFLFVSILSISLLNFRFPLGDFSRFVLPSTISIMIFFGITIDWILESIKNTSIKNGLIALFLTVFVISSYNTSLIVLRDFAETQDDFIAGRLPGAVGECSVFSVNSSIGMTYSEAPSYVMEKLLEDSFLEKHSECKIVISEMECATGRKEMCGKVFDRFKPEELYTENIFNYYDSKISLIPAASPAEID